MTVNYCCLVMHQLQLGYLVSNPGARVAGDVMVAVRHIVVGEPNAEEDKAIHCNWDWWICMSSRNASEYAVMGWLHMNAGTECGSLEAFHPSSAFLLRERSSIHRKIFRSPLKGRRGKKCFPPDVQSWSVDIEVVRVTLWMRESRHAALPVPVYQLSDETLTIFRVYVRT
jgi:hypothetical protein